MLSLQQQETLQTFQDISQIQDDSLSIQILQQNNWNLDLAVNQFVQDQGSSSSSSSSSSENQPRNRFDTNRTAGSSSSTTPPNNVNDVATTNNPANQQQTSMLDLLFLPLRWLFQARPVSMNPNMDTAKFIDEYERQYGSNHPTFQNSSYQSAVAMAHQRSKFLLVYLHSPIHEDTTKFCRQIFNNPELVTLANNQLMTWVGKVWDPEAYGLSSQLKVSTFPFVALLVCQSNRVVQIAERIQGE